MCVTEAGALLRTLSAHEAQASLIHVPPHYPPQVLTSCSHPPKLLPTIAGWQGTGTFLLYEGRSYSISCTSERPL